LKVTEIYRDFQLNAEKYYTTAMIRLTAKTANLYLTHHSSCKKRWLCHKKNEDQAGKKLMPTKINSSKKPETQTEKGIIS
jgi:hypothetical protein